MRTTFAIKLRSFDAVRCLGRLRYRHDLQVCDGEDTVWVRGPCPEGDLESAIRALPGGHFMVMADGQLVPVGSFVPKGYLPGGPWLALSKWMSIALSPAAFSGIVGDSVGLQLIRGGPSHPANVVVLSQDIWQDHVDRAPQIRLDRWSFANSDDGRVVVRGSPAPPLKGQVYVEQAGVAVPAGWTLKPSIDIDVVRDAMDLKNEDLALLHADGSWDHIKAECFVRVTRSAVRLSAGASHE